MMLLMKYPWGLEQEGCFFIKIFRMELKPLDIFEIRPSKDYSYKVW